MKRFVTKYATKPRRMLAPVILLAIAGGIAGFMGMQAAVGSNKIASNVTCDSACVALKPDGMHPDELAIKVGQSVQFNSADGRRHNIAEGDGGTAHAEDTTRDQHDHAGAFVSGEFGPDEAWRVQFKRPGTYKLHDHHNPHQRILIVVYEDKTAHKSP